MKKTLLVALGALALTAPQVITAYADTGSDLLLTDEVAEEVEVEYNFDIPETPLTEADIMPISADEIMPISAEVDDDMQLYEGDLDEHLDIDYTDKELTRGDDITEADIMPVSSVEEATTNTFAILAVAGALIAGVIGFCAMKAKGAKKE